MNSRVLMMLSTLALSMAFTVPAQAAGNAATGKKLHDEKCVACHASRFGGKADEMYTRKERKKKSLSEVRGMVEFCVQQVGVPWLDEEVDHVTTYLNENFYHYK